VGGGPQASLILRRGKREFGADLLVIAWNVIIVGSRRLALIARIGLIAHQQQTVTSHDRPAGLQPFGETGAYFLEIRALRVLGTWHRQTSMME